MTTNKEGNLVTNKKTSASLKSKYKRIVGLYLDIHPVEIPVCITIMNYNYATVTD